MNLIAKGRCAPAELEAKEFSAPGQRSWYLTVPLAGVELLLQLRRGSVQQAANHYNEAGRGEGHWVRLGL
jgi:hypothetical protein